MYIWFNLPLIDPKTNVNLPKKRGDKIFAQKTLSRKRNKKQAMKKKNILFILANLPVSFFSNPI